MHWIECPSFGFGHVKGFGLEGEEVALEKASVGDVVLSRYARGGGVQVGSAPAVCGERFVHNLAAGQEFPQRMGVRHATWEPAPDTDHRDGFGGWGLAVIF